MTLDAVSGWVWWHRVELAATTLPTVAATVSPWWLLATAGMGVWWVSQEHRHRPPAPPVEGDEAEAQRVTA